MRSVFTATFLGPRVLVTIGCLLWSCAGSATDVPDEVPTETDGGAAASADGGGAAPTADVVSVTVSGNPEAYTFSVEVRSPDTGCDQYADWWEVVTDEGQLVYRRILLHSHVTEQPFVRSGGPVSIAADAVVWVRAHLNTSGYGALMRGTASAGFVRAEPDPGFAPNIESAEPQPDGCAF